MMTVVVLRYGTGAVVKTSPERRKFTGTNGQRCSVAAINPTGAVIEHASVIISNLFYKASRNADISYERYSERHDTALDGLQKKK